MLGKSLAIAAWQGTMYLGHSHQAGAQWKHGGDVQNTTRHRLDAGVLWALLLMAK